MSSRDDRRSPPRFVLGYEAPKPDSADGPVPYLLRTSPGAWVFFRATCATTFVLALVWPWAGLSFAAVPVLALPGILVLQIAMAARNAITPSPLRERESRHFVAAAVAHVLIVFAAWWGAFVLLNVRPFGSWSSLATFLAPLIVVPVAAPFWLLRPVRWIMPARHPGP